MRVKDYIKIYYNNNQREFSRATGIDPQHISKMIKGGYVIYDHTLYSKRRDLPRK